MHCLKIYTHFTASAQMPSPFTHTHCTAPAQSVAHRACRVGCARGRALLAIDCSSACSQRPRRTTKKRKRQCQRRRRCGDHWQNLRVQNKEAETERANTQDKISGGRFKIRLKNSGGRWGTPMKKFKNQTLHERKPQNKLTQPYP